MLVTVIVRGYVMWWRRRPVTGARRVGRPPARGVLTGLPPAAAVAEQLPDVPADSIIAEPSARDSMAAIGLAGVALVIDGRLSTGALITLFLVTTQFVGQVDQLARHLPDLQAGFGAVLRLRTLLGAVPDAEGNDLEGVRAALAQATEADLPTEVRFAKGRYHLDADIDIEEHGYARVRFVPRLEGDIEEALKQRPKYDFQKGQRLMVRLRKHGTRWLVVRADMGYSMSGAL